MAADDDRVLGSVTFCPAGSTWREIAWDDEGEFRMLAVAADARGRGVGEALVRACLDGGQGRPAWPGWPSRRWTR